MSKSIEESSEEFKLGAEGFYNGLDKAETPYQMGTWQYLEWVSGWCFANGMNKMMDKMYSPKTNINTIEELRSYLRKELTEERKSNAKDIFKQESEFDKGWYWGYESGLELALFLLDKAEGKENED